MSEIYGELFTVTGLIRPGDRFTLSFDTSTERCVADFRASSRRIVLQLDKKPGTDTVSLSRVLDGGRWENLGEIEVAPRDTLSVVMLVDGDIEVQHPDADPVRVPCGLVVERIQGSGNWTIDRDTRERDRAAVEDIVTDLDGRRPPTPGLNENLIFDLGVYDGADTAYYLWRGFDVVSVEANPALARGCATHFAAEIRAGRLTVVNCAVGDRDGVLPFFVNTTRPEWSSTSQATAARGNSDIVEHAVRMVTPAALFAAFGVPHYLKIDIEGADVTVLKALEEVEALPMLVSFEIGPSIDQSVIERLERLGYTEFNVVNQELVRNQCEPLPDGLDASGRGSEWRFRRGASGSFGDGLPGPWLDAGGVCAWLARFQAEWKRRVSQPSDAENGGWNYGTWYDIHARR